MTYIFHIKSPMSAVERKLNMNNDKIPCLINSLNRSINHPLIKKFSHIPYSENNLSQYGIILPI